MVGRGSGKTEKWSQGKITVRRSIAGIAGELPSHELRVPRLRLRQFWCFDSLMIEQGYVGHVGSFQVFRAI
jgi:hypothetical protein